MRKGERKMVLHAGGLELPPDIGGEDVVEDDVPFAVMLMKAGVLTCIHQVVLHDDPRRALVGIQSPAAVVERIYMMDHVIAYGSAFRLTQAIDAAHIRQFSPAEVMDMVEPDMVPFRGTVPVTPHPSHGNARVAKIRDLVMGDGIIARLEDRHPDGAGKNISARPDDVIIHGNAARKIGR